MGHTRTPTPIPTLWPGMLVGRRMICAYLGISRNTLSRYIAQYRLPVAHLPNGVMFASTSMIDQWLAEAIEAEMGDLRDRRGWHKREYGIYSGIRLAHERRPVSVY